MRKWTCLTLAVIGFLYWLTFGSIVFGAERDRKFVDQKTFNAVMDRQYPNGRGPNTTSRGRGFYRGLDGNWRRR